MASTTSTTEMETRARLVYRAERAAEAARLAEAAEAVAAAASLAASLAYREVATGGEAAEVVADAADKARSLASERASALAEAHGIASERAEKAACEVAALAVVGEAAEVTALLARVAGAASWREDARAWQAFAEVARRGGVEVAS